LVPRAASYSRAADSRAADSRADSHVYDWWNANDEQLKRKAKAIVNDPRVYKDYGGHLQEALDNVTYAASKYLKDPNTGSLSKHGNHREEFKRLIGLWDVMIEPAINVLPRLNALRKKLDSGYIDDPELDQSARTRTLAYLERIHDTIYSFSSKDDWNEIYAFINELIPQIKKKTLGQRLGFRSVRPS
jgi:hypothetical protein